MEEHPGGKLHQLCRTTGKEKRQVRVNAGELAQQVFQLGDALPGDQSSVAPAERFGPGVGARTQEVIEVQGAAFLTDKACELPVGLLGA